ncbi:MCE family protein [Mycobacterium sp. RTGN4]|uniref:MCE family protein n=1 Tax=unclassified Mycobacterium TaxID=2642494 RepID=UPI0039AFD553
MIAGHDAGAHRGLWATGLITVIVVFVAACFLSFRGTFVRSVPVTVTSDRAGLVMEAGGKVKMRGIEVGRVSTIDARPGGVELKLALQPDAVRLMPANIQAQIRTTTLFGSKYVDLVIPEKPESQQLRAGSVIRSRNVTTEVNTVFENLTTLLRQVEPAKLNAVVSAAADAVRGKGDRIGQATTDALDVTRALSDRTDALRNSLNSLTGATDAYGAAAGDIVSTLSALSTTSNTISSQADDLQAALLSAIGLSNSGIELLGPTKDNFVNAFSKLTTTTDLLHKYSPTYTCLLQGAYWILYDAGGNSTNGRSAITDAGLAGLAQDPYRYPENLPIVGAKGGPDGKPSCGALPRPDLNMPVRYLVTNTGFGTGMDIRPNPGIAHPWLMNFFPATKAIPEPPKIYGAGPPAIGPVPYPGAPPYGAPLFGPDGTPLWAPPPAGAGPPPVPGVPIPPAPYGPGPELPGPTESAAPETIAPNDGAGQ